jgi:hypothetical protein
MVDDPKKRGAAHRARINLHQEQEVRYWAKKWGITAEQLRDAVGEVGSMAGEVAKYLGKDERRPGTPHSVAGVPKIIPPSSPRWWTVQVGEAGCTKSSWTAIARLSAWPPAR